MSGGPGRIPVTLPPLLFYLLLSLGFLHPEVIIQLLLKSLNEMNYSCGIDQILIAIWGCIFGDGNLLHVMEANLDALQKTMKQLEEIREDLLRRVAEEEDKGLQRTAQVRGWLSRVEDNGPQVTDLLEDRSTETNRLCFFRYFSWRCISSCDYGGRVANKLLEVKELLSEGAFEVVANRIPAAKAEEKHIPDTVGLDAKFKEAWECLMEGARRLGLYGMGGVGKTTLLAGINNKFIDAETEFKIVIWVVVSKDLRIEDIQDQILQRLRSDKEWKEESGDEKASLIYNNLKGKKFVLLLDDLWGEVDLKKIGVPPPTQENGSKIVFTTRSKEVCKRMEADAMIEVVCLPLSEAWELFEKNVGENPLKSLPVARKIAQECCGLPLALCVLGKAMGCKETEREWHNDFKKLSSSSHKFPDMKEKVLSILKFSYDNLKDEKVKLCFRYCSLFPEGSEVDKEELIQYWICEGFIDGSEDENGAYDQGHDIIGSLVRSQLLMEGLFSWTVKMHDVMRDMALWIDSDFEIQKETLCVQSGAQLSQIPNNINWETATKISLMRNQIIEIPGSSKSPNLLTLFLNENKLAIIPGAFFHFMPTLVVLNLSMNFGFSTLPEEISKLVSLQYLNLSYTVIQWLPDGLKELKNLINLNLEYTLVLQSIVGITTGLPMLQVLRLFSSYVCIDDSLLEELQHLKHLNYLTATVNNAFTLLRIQADMRLRSILRGLCLRNISAPIVLNMVALASLERLDILLCSISEFIILGNNDHPTFKQVSRVHVVGVQGSKDLTWLLYFQNLKFLAVARSPNIEEIINKEKAMSDTYLQPELLVPFEKLELFWVHHMDKLKRIGLDPPALPNLRQFGVVSSPELLQAEFPRTGAHIHNV